jgi:hypothetical protein
MGELRAGGAGRPSLAVARKLQKELNVLKGMAV